MLALCNLVLVLGNEGGGHHTLDLGIGLKKLMVLILNTVVPLPLMLFIRKCILKVILYI